MVLFILKLKNLQSFPLIAFQLLISIINWNTIQETWRYLKSLWKIKSCKISCVPSPPPPPSKTISCDSYCVCNVTYPEKHCQDFASLQEMIIHSLCSGCLKSFWELNLNHFWRSSNFFQKVISVPHLHTFKLPEAFD